MAGRSREGLQRDFDALLAANAWAQINRDPNECLGRRCPLYNQSFYFRARERWRNADILIVNHSLLASHFAYNEGLLPAFDAVVIDEAHSFASIFQQAWRQGCHLPEAALLLESLGTDFRSAGALMRSLQTRLQQTMPDRYGRAD